MSLVKSLVSAVRESVPTKTKRKKRVRRVDNRIARFKDKASQPMQWNTHDVLSYYQLVFKSKYGYFPIIRISKDSGLCSWFCRQFLHRNLVDLENVKYAIQIFFTRCEDEPPLSFGYMANTRSVMDIKKHWDYPLSRKVMDDKVLSLLAPD